MPNTAKSIRDKNEQTELQRALFDVNEEFVASATNEQWQAYLDALVAGVEFSVDFAEQQTTEHERVRKRTLSATIEPSEKKKSKPILLTNKDVKGMRSNSISRSVSVY